MSKQALIILSEGHEEVEAITIIDLLRRADIGVTIAGLNKIKVKGAHGITIETDILLERFKGDFDAIILPGGMPGTNFLKESKAVLSIVYDSYERGLLCAAICAAPIVLNAAGILSAKKFTCYPNFEEQIPEGIFVKEPVVKDGSIITSRGIGTAIPFSLTIISYLYDRSSAETIASQILYADKF